MKTFPRMEPGEKLPLTFDFRKRLARGEAILSTLVEVTMAAGVDDNPMNIRDGGAFILVGRVVQRVIDVTPGVTYEFKVSATTNGPRTLVGRALLPVKKL